MFPHTPGDAARFHTTSWSMVVAAAQKPTSDTEAALEKLCRTYWYPVYAFVRRWGRDTDDAADLTQEFFSRVLERNYLSTADPSRRRFRSFLLAAVRHFLINEWDKEQAQKRGGGTVKMSFDIETAEGRYSLEPPDNQTPEKLYTRQWALALLDEVLASLKLEYAEEGKAGQFDKVAPLLAGNEVSYADIGREWNCSEGAVRVAVHRARKRYRDLLRKMIAETVADPADVDDEVRFLLAALDM
jgi:RNA polymerase sigma factor (sigma-70 family)